MKLEKILAPTDFSELSRSGVYCALEMALEQGGEVIIYHVISEDGGWFGKNDALNPAAALVPIYEQRMTRFVDETCGDFRGRVVLRAIVEAGIPYNEIVRKAAEENADLIIMSTHGRTGLDHFLLGSVTERVLAHAPCPVLVIPPA
jgi:nucleotide-binding universal stress UspA family protein